MRNLCVVYSNPPESKLLYKVYNDKSLVQVHVMLTSAIDEIVQKCAVGVVVFSKL